MACALRVHRAVGPSAVEDDLPVTRPAIDDGPARRARPLHAPGRGAIDAGMEKEEVAGRGRRLRRGEALEWIGGGPGAAALAGGDVAHAHSRGLTWLGGGAQPQDTLGAAPVGVAKRQAHLVLRVGREIHDAAGEEPAPLHAERWRLMLRIRA